MLLLALIVAVLVGITVWSAMTKSPERYPTSLDHERDYDLRRRRY